VHPSCQTLGAIKVTVVRKLLVLVVGIVAASMVCAKTYQHYWLNAAEQEVMRAANSISKGSPIDSVVISQGDTKQDLFAAFGAGYKVVGWENDGFGLREFQIKVRVANGDQYNFDIQYVNDGWRVSCCDRYRAIELKP
jgi:hypothetical protein